MPDNSSTDPRWGSGKKQKVAGIGLVLTLSKKELLLVRSLALVMASHLWLGCFHDKGSGAAGPFHQIT